ncbi:MAG: YheC/YheD family protein [Bacteroidia bacterium]|nr:YheC/YheD family protein [Bacteroidia bacterium]
MRELGIIAQIENNPELFGKATYYFQDMVNYGKELPVKIYVFSPVDWLDNSNIIIAYYYEDGLWKKIKRSIPNLIYDRFTAKTKFENDRIEIFRNFLINNNYNFLINPSLSELLKNKIKFHDYLINNNFPTIHGFKISDLTMDIIETLFKYNDTIYIKPIFGSGGFGIAICEKEDDKIILKIDKEIHTFDYSNIINEILNRFNNDYFIQSKVHTINYENSPYDIRVLVQNYGNQNYEITGMAVRMGQKNSWVSNLNSGGKGYAFEELEPFFYETYQINDLRNKISQICIDCCYNLDKQFGSFVEIAFDILLTLDKGPIIIEGNSKPARWVFNTIADNYQANSEQEIKYKELRRKTVILPLIYVSNNKFNNMETKIEIITSDNEVKICQSLDLFKWLNTDKIIWCNS